MYLIYEIDVWEGDEEWESEITPKGYITDLAVAQSYCETKMEIAGGAWREKSEKEGKFVAGWSPMAWGYKLLNDLAPQGGT